MEMVRIGTQQDRQRQAIQTDNDLTDKQEANGQKVDAVDNKTDRHGHQFTMNIQKQRHKDSDRQINTGRQCKKNDTEGNRQSDRHVQVTFEFE